MKKILYMNLLPNNVGQKRMDINIIKELGKVSNLTVLSPMNWYAQKFDYVNYEDIQYKFDNRTKVKYFLNNIHSILKAVIYDKKNYYDYFFFASYETCEFLLMSLLLPRIKDRVYIVHNNNIDFFERNKLKKMCFNWYARRIHHIVLEEFIKEHLVESYGLDADKVHCLPHPLNHIMEKQEKVYDCVGISNSNNEDWIKAILSLEQEKKIFQNNNLRIVLRSKKLSFDDGYLKIINGFLEDSKYYNFILSAKSIFLPYPETFKYRMSGSLVDALSNNTAVIGTDIPLFRFFEKKYATTCVTVKSYEEFVNCMMKMNNVCCDDDCENFRQSHNQNILRNKLINIFNINRNEECHE